MPKSSKTKKWNRAPFLRNRYGCSDPTIYRWTKSGKIPKPKYLNGQRVWSDEDIALADKNLISAEPTESATRLPHANMTEG
jgi:predicted DNA-binding transcriptional regulator AlpA